MGWGEHLVSNVYRVRFHDSVSLSGLLVSEEFSRGYPIPSLMTVNKNFISFTIFKITRALLLNYTTLRFK